MKGGVGFYSIQCSDLSVMVGQLYGRISVM